MAKCAFAVVKNKDGKILLVQIAPPFREDHKWNFPGGVIEDGEDIEIGLAREILEETNVVCKITDMIDKFTTYDPENVIHIFNGTYVSGDIKPQLHEILQAKWFTIEEALELPMAHNSKTYIEKLNKL
jgi:8-oxo-dGTP diphosphatase